MLKKMFEAYTPSSKCSMAIRLGNAKRKPAASNTITNKVSHSERSGRGISQGGAEVIAADGLGRGMKRTKSRHSDGRQRRGRIEDGRRLLNLVCRRGRTCPPNIFVVASPLLNPRLTSFVREPTIQTQRPNPRIPCRVRSN